MQAIRETLGCDRPEDELPETEYAAICAICHDHEHHDAPRDPDAEAHGKWHIGIAGYGFRTNACPRTWAGHPLVAEAFQAWRWAESGMFNAVYGLHVPNRLVEAVDYLRSEVSAILTERSRLRRADLEARRKGRDLRDDAGRYLSDVEDDE